MAWRIWGGEKRARRGVPPPPSTLPIPCHRSSLSPTHGPSLGDPSRGGGPQWQPGRERSWVGVQLCAPRRVRVYVCVRVCPRSRACACTYSCVALHARTGTHMYRCACSAQLRVHTRSCLPGTPTRAHTCADGPGDTVADGVRDCGAGGVSPHPGHPPLHRYLLGHGVDEANVEVLLGPEPCGEREGVSPAPAPHPPGPGTHRCCTAAGAGSGSRCWFSRRSAPGGGRTGDITVPSRCSPPPAPARPRAAELLWQLPTCAMSLGEVSASAAQASAPLQEQGDGQAE